jgi:hypothetical protein
VAEMRHVTANSLCEQTKSRTYSKNLGISQRAIVERLNINLAMSVRLLQVWFTKCVCSMGTVSPYTQNEERKTGNMSAITFLLQK